jgi:hypothetical protein
VPQRRRVDDPTVAQYSTNRVEIKLTADATRTHKKVEVSRCSCSPSPASLSAPRCGGRFQPSPPGRSHISSPGSIVTTRPRSRPVSATPSFILPPCGLGERFKPCDRFNQGASSMQIKASQRKEMKIAFICFHKLFGIRTFQWVTADSNRKNSFLLNSRSGLCAKPLKSRYP